MKSAKRTLFSRAPPPAVETDYWIHLHVHQFRNESLLWQGVKFKKRRLSIIESLTLNTWWKGQFLNPVSQELRCREPKRIASFHLYVPNIYNNSLTVNRLTHVFCKKIFHNLHKTIQTRPFGVKTKLIAPVILIISSNSSSQKIWKQAFVLLYLH